MKGDDYCWKVCPGPAAVSEKGQNIVRLSAFKAPDEFLNNEALDKSGDYAHPEPQAVTATLSDEAERALVVIIATLFGEDNWEDDTNLLLFKRFFHGKNLRQAGEDLSKIRPITKQAVHKRALDMLRRNTVFSRCLVHMIHTGKGGAKGCVTQMSLPGFGDGKPDTFGELEEQVLGVESADDNHGADDGGGKD